MKRLITIVAVLLLITSTATADVNSVRKPDNRTTELMGDDGGRQVGGVEIIDTCEATTNWTALGNDTTGFATDLDHVVGTKSLEFDKVDGAANTVFGAIYQTFTTAKNLDWYIENEGSFGYSLNVSSVADIDYCFIRLGTSASHYNEWRVPDTALTTGWQRLKFNASSPNTSGATGNGWNSAAVLYIVIGCAFDAQDDTLADLRFDHVTANSGLQVTAETNPSASSSSSTSSTVVKPVPLVWDSDNAANCKAITNASVQMTLDTGSDHFRCCAWGNAAYVLSGANPTATTTVTTGFSFIIGEGQCHDFSTADAKIAVIGTATAGNYCCISLETP